jgi:hypothetical protein
MKIWGNEKIFIDGIGQRGLINGGFLSMKPDFVEQVFVKWLEGRGFKVYALAKLTATEENIAEDAPMKKFFVTVDTLEESQHVVSVFAHTAAEANKLALNNEGEYVRGSDNSAYECIIIGVQEDETEEANSDNNKP